MANTYSLIDVQATLIGAGAVITLGAGAAVSEEGITIARAGDKSTMTIGADGEGMHSLHADKSGTVTIHLLKTSPTNAKLMALYDAQAASSALWGANTITVVNPHNGEVTEARGVAFKKCPDITYAKDGGTVAWAFDAIKIDTVLGLWG